MIRRTIFALLALAMSAAIGQQYRWIDKDGKVHFSDTPPPAGARDVRQTGGTPAKPAAAPESTAPRSMPYEVARLQKDFPVTLYTMPNCKEVCETARATLNRRGVPFKEVQVWDGETKAELKRVSGGDEIPVLLVGRRHLVGFAQVTFDALLDSAGYPKTGVVPALSQKAPGTPEGYVAPAERAATQENSPQEPAPPPAGPYNTNGLRGPAPVPGQYKLPGATR